MAQKKQSDEKLFDKYENCKIYPRKAHRIKSGGITFDCDSAQIFGSHRDSFEKPVGAFGKCKMTEKRGKFRYNRKIGDNVNVILTNEAGLDFRTKMGIIPPSDYKQTFQKKIPQNFDDADKFKCGCIVDERRFKKGAEKKYIPVAITNNDRIDIDKEIYTRFYPVSWIEKYIEVDDGIFENKKIWISESEYKKKRSLLNRDEKSDFLATGKQALACYPIEESVTAVNRFIDDSIRKYGPYFMITKNGIVDINGNRPDITDNIVCKIKDKVPDPNSESKREIPLREAEKKIGGYDFHYAIKSYYDPNDVDKSITRVGFQCIDEKSGNTLAEVTMKISNPKFI